MVTLEEAVAKYVEAKDILIEYADTRREHYPDGMGWAVETLDAAVRDVAIEAMRQMQERSGYVWEGAGELKAEINRLLGDLPHG